MKRLFMVLLMALPLLMAGCGLTRPGARIASVEYVEYIPAAGGVSYQWEGKDIIKVVLDFKFDEKLAAGLDPKSDAYRDNLYDKLVKGAHFYLDNKEVGHTYGYWPKEAGKDFAKDLTLFYVVPKGPSSGSLKFVFDTALLGEGAPVLDTAIHPKNKPFAPFHP